MIAEVFEQNFGIAPKGQIAVPGRVNLIGEHTDYNGGMVLPTVLDCKIDVAAGPSSDGNDHFYSEGYGMAPIEDANAPLDPESWWAYARGSLAWARSHDHSLPPLAFAFNSDLPGGSGLSSSAAMIVGIFKALRNSGHLDLDDVEIAVAAQVVENDYVGMPCGIMDQMAVSVGKPKMALALDTGTLAFEHAPLPKSHDFAVIHSGVTRKLTDGRYKYRRIECEKATELLGVDELCKMSETEIARLSELPENLARRARHAVTEHSRVVAAVQALKVGELERFGVLMNESHASYRDDFEASTPEIDLLVNAATRFGALGARLTGGGFGGCIVACIEKANRQDWQKQLTEQFPRIRVIC